MRRLGWPAYNIHVPYLTLHARQREAAYHPPLSTRELAVGKVSCRGTPAPLQQVIPMCMCMDKVHPVAAVVY
jgi:hypothetical protein